MTDIASLSPQHLSMLREESGIAETIIAARGYRTVTQETELVRLGFAAAQRRVPGLLLPLHTTDGRSDGYIYLSSYTLLAPARICCSNA